MSTPKHIRALEKRLNQLAKDNDTFFVWIITGQDPETGRIKRAAAAFDDEVKANICLDFQDKGLEPEWFFRRLQTNDIYQSHEDWE